jgi:hypothetical protein
MKFHTSYLGAKICREKPTPGAFVILFVFIKETKKLQSYTLVGVDLTAHSSSLLGGRRRPLDHAATATFRICTLRRSMWCSAFPGIQAA